MAGSALKALLGAMPALVPWAAFAERQPPISEPFDHSIVRTIPVQHDGRWPPLDTVARDLVESVTGETDRDGRDPVTMLLSWTFLPDYWMSQPLITIANAELRRELKLPASQAVFSYRELAFHQPLSQLIDGLARSPRGRKMNPLESKASNIQSQLNTLSDVFRDTVLRVVPDPQDPLGTWQVVGASHDDDPPQLASVREAYNALKAAFVAGDGPAYAQASASLRSILASLPAAYRPAEKKIDVEVWSNRLRPFRIAWWIMAAGAVLAAVALVVRRKALNVIAVVALLAGFTVLTYGLSLRWQIAGRIPAANMFESLLFLSWGMGAFAIVSMVLIRDRVVPLTASAMGALALFLADVLPLDHFIRPIPPVLRDTVWMSIHVPVIMVSYSVLALAMLIAHVQIVVTATAPGRRALITAIDTLHYWYVHVGSILLLAGIATGSMWAASSWGRYWGWDPKEVWSLIALLGYLALLHARADRQMLPKWVYLAGGLLGVAVIILAASGLSPMTGPKVATFAAAAMVVAFFVTARGAFATAVKSILAFWMIIMTYLGVNYVLGIGLHSYGFGTGAVVRYMFLVGGIDLLIVAVCGLVHLARGRLAATASRRVAARATAGPVPVS